MIFNVGGGELVESNIVWSFMLSHVGSQNQKGRRKWPTGLKIVAIQLVGAVQKHILFIASRVLKTRFWSSKAQFVAWTNSDVAEMPDGIYMEIESLRLDF